MTSAISAEKRKLEGGQPTLKQRLLHPLGEWLVYGPIKDQFGLTRLRGAFTGGEAMGEDTFVFYRALGIKLRQLYGQTETSAYNAIQGLERGAAAHRWPSPARRRCADQRRGEILVRSGSVFSGYFKQDEATRESLDDGWLHTGDAGYLEPDGHLVVLGRLSDVVHTAKRRALYSQLHREPAQVQSVHQGCGGARKRPRRAVGHRLHRQGSGRSLGRAARHFLHVVCRPVAEAGGHRPDRRRRETRQQRTLPKRTAAAAFRLPAQGIRCRRRRDHAHPQDPPQRRGGALQADHRRHLRSPEHGADESKGRLRDPAKSASSNARCRYRRPDRWTGLCCPNPPSTARLSA